LPRLLSGARWPSLSLSSLKPAGYEGGGVFGEAVRSGGEAAGANKGREVKSADDATLLKLNAAAANDETCCCWCCCCYCLLPG